MTFLQADAAGAGGVVGSFLPLIIVFVVFYFILIRPQQQQQKKRREMLQELKKGDKVVTIGGIHGEITAIDEEDLNLRIAEKVEVRISRSGIARVKGQES